MYGLFQKQQSKEPIFSAKKPRAAQNTNAHALPKASITPKKKPSAPKSQPPHIHPQNHQSHSVPFHTACSIASRSTQHRLTLHGASAHAPRCIASCSTLHKSSLFQVLVSPSSRRPLAPLQSLLSCMLRFHRNLPALFVHFPPVARASRSFSLRPSVSRLVSRLASRLASCLSPVRSSAFPSRMLRFHRNLPALSASSRLLPALPALPASFRLPPDLPALPPPVPCLAWREYRKSPPGLLSEGF